MHHHVDGRKFLGRRTGAAQADVAFAIHRQRRHEVIAVRGLNKPLLKQGAVLDPDFVPENAATPVGRALRHVATKDAAVTCEDTQRSQAIVGPELLSLLGPCETPLPGQALA